MCLFNLLLFQKSWWMLPYIYKIISNLEFQKAFVTILSQLKLSMSKLASKQIDPIIRAFFDLSLQLTQADNKKTEVKEAAYKKSRFLHQKVWFSFIVHGDSKYKTIMSLCSHSWKIQCQLGYATFQTYFAVQFLRRNSQTHPKTFLWKSRCMLQSPQLWNLPYFASNHKQNTDY